MEDSDITIEEEEADGGAAKFRDLRTRVISGLVLALIAVGVIYAGALPFAILVGIISIIMSWEWGRLVRGGEFDISFVIHASAMVVAVVLAAIGQSALGLVALVIAAIIVGVLNIGENGRLSGLGVLYVGIPALTLVWLRSDEPMGLLAVVFVFVVVWSADTFAFMGGRFIGGPRLLPAVSPNKTWSGFFSGLIGGVVAGALFAIYVSGSPLLHLMIWGAVLAAFAQVGDLIESALKRAFDVKDASGLIPGHGGFMDRMDGVVLAALAVGLWALVMSPTAPAHGLLMGI